MKKRQGFVSNSSSSSFIVALAHRPESRKDLRKMIFGKQKFFSVGFDETDKKYPTWQVAETIMESLDKESSDIYEIAETLDGGWLDGMPDYHDFQDSDGKIDWDKYNVDCKDYANKIAQKFMDENKDAFIFCTSYSDDTDYGCAMEHGRLFDKVKHIQVSNH